MVNRRDTAQHRAMERRAATTPLVVNTTADSGTGSLREAIALAQNGDTIQFASTLKGKTITLTSQLDVTKSVTLDGSKARGLSLSGNQTNRILRVGGDKSVTLKHLTLRQGRATGGSSEETNGGGAILTGNSSVLTIVSCRFEGNVAGYGGAIYAGYRGKTVVINTAFVGNDGTLDRAERGGGAIATKSAGSLTVRGSYFAGNRGINGGAINSLLGDLLIENSVFRQNDSLAGATGNGTSGYGGAIYTDGANASGPNATPGNTGGTIAIRNSRFESNRGAGQGGGLFLFAYPPDQVIIENSVIIGNSVVSDGKGDALGGGLRHGNAALTIHNTTFANNSAIQQGGGLWIGEKSPVLITNSTFSGNGANDGQGGGLGGAIAFANGNSYAAQLQNLTVAYNRAGFMGGAFWSGSQPITLADSIIAFNTAGNPWGSKQQTGVQLQDGGRNIQFPAPTDSDDIRVTAGVRLVDPRLAPLNFNGGFAPVHALLQGSPAVGSGSAALTHDQWGRRRDSQPDVGAIERTSRITVTGTAANDLLVGTSGRDALLGMEGDDVLMGTMGRDRIKGGGGADYFMFSAPAIGRVAALSPVRAVDRILDFNATQGDRLLVDFDGDWLCDRPTALFNAGQVGGKTLTDAMANAFSDKNQRTPGRQALKQQEAVYFGWERRRFMAINERGKSAKGDWLVEMTGSTLMGRDAQAGVLAVEHYFA